MQRVRVGWLAAFGCLSLLLPMLLGATAGCSSTASPADAAGAHDAPATDATQPAPDAAPRVPCNVDDDCGFRAEEGCCGGCIARTDTPRAPTNVCTVACVIPPGGCSCVNHACTIGVLKESQSCDTAHDACGNGLKCCQRCSGVPVDGGAACDSPVCTQSVPQNISHAWVCPPTI